MFWMKWAYRNLTTNRKRTLGTVFFILVVLMITIVDLTFLEGANQQMLQSIRNNRGDLNSISRGLNQSALPVYRYLSGKYSGLVEDNIKIYSKNAQLVGPEGYAAGEVIGTEPVFLKYLNRNVSWTVKPLQNLKTGTALVEVSLARKLNLKRDDYLTIQVRTDAGMVNTIQVAVDGTFIGSNLIYSDKLFINISDANALYMVEDQLNEVRTYFNKNVSNDSVVNVIKDLSARFFELALFQSPRLEPTKDSVFSSFIYYRFLLVFIFFMLNVVFIIILYFAIQNIFFMNFRERRQELSTLLTYGMKPSRIKYIVFWESLYMFILSLVAASALSFAVITVLKNFSITSPKIADLIVALGGPRLCFSVNILNVSFMIGFILLITIYSAYKGANAYLKMEVREIISSV